MPGTALHQLYRAPDPEAPVVALVTGVFSHPDASCAFIQTARAAFDHARKTDTLPALEAAVDKALAFADGLTGWLVVARAGEFRPFAYAVRLGRAHPPALYVGSTLPGLHEESQPHHSPGHHPRPEHASGGHLDAVA